MTGPAQLRPARDTDAGKLGAILSQFIDDTPWMPRIHTRAEDVAHAGAMIDRGWVTVAAQDGRVCGFVACNGPELNALYVTADARGTGIGGHLLHHAKTQSDRLELWTFEANTGAQRFYERAGFTLAGRTDGGGNDEGLPDRRYVWQRPAGPLSQAQGSTP